MLQVNEMHACNLRRVRDDPALDAGTSSRALTHALGRAKCILQAILLTNLLVQPDGFHLLLMHH
jgi:hypothetical protein